MVEFTPEILKKLRAENRYSQSYIADFIGISQNAYSKWERGVDNPKYDKVLKLLELYKIDDGEKDKRPPPRDCTAIEKGNDILIYTKKLKFYRD